MRDPSFSVSARFLAVAVVLSVVSSRASAELVRVEIERREPFAGGTTFGTVGAYESIRGRFHFEVDPEAPANGRVVDLTLAPRNERGRVEFWSDFVMLTPADPARGNRRLLYDVTNRGNLLALWTFNEGERTNDPRDASHAGNGFLMRRGFTLLWSGWNGDVMDDGTDRLLVGLPVATDGGEPIRGKIHLELSVDEPQRSYTFGFSPWGVAAAYPTVDVADPDATLTARPDRSSPPTEIPRDRWRFARWEAAAEEDGGDKKDSDGDDEGTFVEDPRSVAIDDGFRPGWLYDVTYTAEAPRVAGLGMAGIRDAVSHLRYGTRTPRSRDGSSPSGDGSPGEQGGGSGLAGGVVTEGGAPITPRIDRAYLFGISQSGRLVHQYLDDGFQIDTSGRSVFDGTISLVGGAGRGQFNRRFGLKTLYSTQHRDHLAGSDTFPFATVKQEDPRSGEVADRFATTRESGHLPKSFFVQTSTEYWSRGASLLHAGVAGQEDLEVDPSSRIYFIAGSSHLGAQPPTPGIGQTPRNPLWHRGPVLRALLVAMDRWASHAAAPPPSRYPRIDDGTLVDVATFRDRFPRIPGVDLPTDCYRPLRLDFGSRFESDGIADVVPPTTGDRYEALVPQVDSDGNELAGIRLPEIEVPIATYTGWSLRSAEVGAEGMLAGLDGSYVPFPRTAGARESTGDPRTSVHERYPTRDVYLGRFTDATLSLHRDGFLLAEDAVEMIRRASRRELWD